MPAVSVYEASKQSGLTVSTIRTYCKRGRSNLIRHQDYFVRRRSYNRYQLMITPDGLKRLCLRAYTARNTSPPNPGSKTAIVRHTARLAIIDKVRAWTGFSGRERFWRLADVTRSILDNYLSNPCALTNCPCIIHKLGVPQLATLIEAWQAGKHNSNTKPPWERGRG